MAFAAVGDEWLPLSQFTSVSGCLRTATVRLSSYLGSQFTSVSECLRTRPLRQPARQGRAVSIHFRERVLTHRSLGGVQRLGSQFTSVSGCLRTPTIGFPSRAVRSQFTSVSGCLRTELEEKFRYGLEVSIHFRERVLTHSFLAADVAVFEESQFTSVSGCLRTVRQGHAQLQDRPSQFTSVSGCLRTLTVSCTTTGIVSIHFRERVLTHGTARHNVFQDFTTGLNSLP